MTAEDLKTKSVDELSAQLLEERKNKFNLRFQKNGGTLEDTSAMRKSRRNIARIKTLLTQKRKEEDAGTVKN